jgi:hypothetical protein
MEKNLEKIEILSQKNNQPNGDIFSIFGRIGMELPILKIKTIF